MRIGTDDYQVVFQAEQGLVVFQGIFRLTGNAEYQPISQLLEQAAENNAALTLDLRQLEFLNSSGINTLSKFVIAMRRKAEFQLTVQGAANSPWQSKSLLNLQRLMPALQLQLS